MATNSPSKWIVVDSMHIPKYQDHKLLLQSCSSLSRVVDVTEIKMLLQKLKTVNKRGAFLITVGDCAESLNDSNEKMWHPKVDAFSQIANKVEAVTEKPVVLLSRFAGQFFKPRSSQFEQLDNGVEVPSYKGDGVNAFSSNERTHDASRLIAVNSASIKAYQFAQNHPCFSSTNTRQFFISHEGLHLPYESALTVKNGSDFFDLSAHFLWIGERTRQIEGSHVDFFKNISNPIGIKIGQKSNPEDIVRLCRKLNPENHHGRLTLITRLSSSKVRARLPPLIRAVKKARINVIWQVDPMHGNTEVVSGIKTRRVDSILAEIRESAAVHREEGTYLGGLHIESTGEDVTECIGGTENPVREESIGERYRSLCDPRLNLQQSLEVAAFFASLVNDLN